MPHWSIPARVNIPKSQFILFTRTDLHTDHVIHTSERTTVARSKEVDGHDSTRQDVKRNYILVTHISKYMYVICCANRVTSGKKMTDPGGT